MSNVLLPNRDTNRAGATFSAGAILEAVDFLGLQWPVEIQWGAPRAYYGLHRAPRSGRDDARYQNRHLIKIGHDYDAAQVGETLWHELTHAAQAERFPSMDDFKIASSSERRRVGYDRSAFEVEARAAESFNADIPLAR